MWRLTAKYPHSLVNEHTQQKVQEIAKKFCKPSFTQLLVYILSGQCHFMPLSSPPPTLQSTSC